MTHRSATGTALLVLALTTAWVTLASQQRHMSVNPASRYATMEALVEQGTFAIDDTRLVGMTVDKVRWDGHFYSSKPPLLPLLLAPAYAAVRAATDAGFREDLYGTVMWMRLIVAVAPWVAAMLLWWALLRRVTDDPATRVWAFSAMVLSGLPTAYASHLDNHSFATLGLIAAALAIAPITSDALPPGRLRWVAGGLCGGAATTFDLGAMPIVGLVGLVVVWRLWREDRVAALAFAASGLAFPALQGAMQWAMSGSPLPFYVRGEAYDYEGSYWRNPIEFDALDEPKLVYAFHALLGHHGLFSLTPWLAVGVPLGGAIVRDRRALWTHWSGRVALAAAASVAFVVVYYITGTSNYGGRCVGMRWWMILHPVIGSGAALYAARTALVARRPFALGVLIGLGAASALSGALNPWEEGLVYAFWRALGLGSVAG